MTYLSNINTLNKNSKPYLVKIENRPFLSVTLKDMSIEKCDTWHFLNAYIYNSTVVNQALMCIFSYIAINFVTSHKHDKTSTLVKWQYDSAAHDCQHFSTNPAWSTGYRHPPSNLNVGDLDLTVGTNFYYVNIACFAFRAARLGPFKWNQALHSSEVIGAIRKENGGRYYKSALHHTYLQNILLNKGNWMNERSSRRTFYSDIIVHDYHIILMHGQIKKNHQGYIELQMYGIVMFDK